MNFPNGTVADQDYEAWRQNWKAPQTAVKALPGFAIVEFGPIANRGAIICPSAVSYNAMMVNDGNCQRPSREGYLPAGTEIVFFGSGDGSFEVTDRFADKDEPSAHIVTRILHRVKRSQVEIYIPKEDAA